MESTRELHLHLYNNRVLYPNMKVLVELAALCPFGNATVERVFSQLTLIKTKLRNQLGQTKLDMLMRAKYLTKDTLRTETNYIICRKLFFFSLNKA